MNRIARVQRWLIYATLAALAASGTVWAAFHYFVAGKQAAAGEAVAMKIHGAVAMIALLTLGTILPGHVPKGWRGRKNKLSGAAILASCAVLVASGYLLYYAGGEALRQLASYIHLSFGVALAVLAVVHVTARLSAQEEPP